jgi:hypothetical protein
MGTAEKQSINSDNAFSTRVRVKSRNAGPSASAMNNAWRKAKEDDPTLEYRMSFVEYKKKYEGIYYRRQKLKKRGKDISGLSYDTIGLI